MRIAPISNGVNLFLVYWAFGFFDSPANENERGQDNYDPNGADESDGNGQSDTVDEIEHGFR